jgi:hypothetical protein
MSLEAIYHILWEAKVKSVIKISREIYLGLLMDDPQRIKTALGENFSEQLFSKLNSLADSVKDNLNQLIKERSRFDAATVKGKLQKFMKDKSFKEIQNFDKFFVPYYLGLLDESLENQFHPIAYSVLLTEGDRQFLKNNYLDLKKQFLKITEVTIVEEIKTEIKIAPRSFLIYSTYEDYGSEYRMLKIRFEESHCENFLKSLTKESV